jgi:glutamate 5-kinase
MDFLSLASRQLRRAADIVDKIEKLKEELSAILGSSASTAGAPKRKRKLSDAARLAIAAGQKVRWAKQKAKSVVKPAAKKTRTMNAAARAKIAAAARARWAKAKAAGKTSL